MYTLFINLVLYFAALFIAVVDRIIITGKNLTKILLAGMIIITKHTYRTEGTK
jgi:hypothetical protein